jgi:ABC-type enterochelin transport system substrate-binding protein
MEKPKIGPPVLSYSDHHENFTMFNVEVKEANLGNHYEAKIETSGKVFTARHASKSQAIADVNAAVREAHKRGEITPGKW